MRVFTRLLWLALSFVAVLLIGASSVMYAKVVPKKPISTGKDYYIVFPHAAYGDQNVEALVNSPVKQKIHIQAAGTAGGGGNKNIPVNQYQDIETGIFHIERNSEVMDPKGAARITTASPVSVIGQFGTTGISGTYNALPVTAWGTDYIVLDEPEGTNSGYQGYYPGVYSIPQVTIIASQPGTTVLVTLPSGGVRTAMGKTGTFSITFNNAGDVYYFSDGADPAAINRVENTCLSPSGDFTGTHIISTDPKKPIGVIVSQSHTSEPCGDNECGDFGMEWLPPICNWDTAYIITASVPHGGTDPGQGELLRVTFAYNNTTLYTEDANGKTPMGTFNAGDPLFIGNPIIDPYVLSADQPFLVCEITTKPQSCLVGNRGGGANFTFSMVFLTGVTQWSDYVPFGTADLAASSQANIYFRQADEHRLYFNGVPLLLVSPVVNKIPGTPYAYLATPLGSNTYYEMRGDSGAAAGGSIFGYGQSQVSSNNGNKNDHTLNPEMVKSFAHPIGVNALPSCSPDTTPPHVAIHYNCGYWFPDTAWDDELVPPATGMYDIYLAENTAPPGATFPPDSSYNVQWSPAPSFTLGTNLGVTFGVQVLNLADTAVAALHFRDGAGNEYDTILVYFPPKLIVTPTSIDVGALRQGTTANASITLTDSGIAPTIFTTLRLAIGKYWKIVNNPPISLPLTIQPDSSFTVQLQYTAPISATYECDPDTLIVNTCRQFPIATMIGCTKKPAINSSDYDFQCWTIDTLGLGGDTVYSLQNKHGVYVASIGSDTMHVTAATLAALNPAAPYDPTVDFAITGYYDKVKKANISLPDTLPPGDTMFVIVRGHPHQAGTITAQILYTDDANHYLRDTSILTICGLVPGIVTHNVDFGTHLYATAKDSFVVVKNSGQVPITVERLSPFGPDSAYFPAYPIDSFYIDPTSNTRVAYPDTFLIVGPSGAAGDSARYPFRFYAWKLGANVDSVSVANTSPTQPNIELTALVVQPHVWGQGSCPNDSVFVGSTGTQTIMIGNQGSDVLNIDSLIIGGVNASEWGVTTIVKKSDGSNVPWPPPPYTPMAPGDTWVVTLTFTPNHVGPSNGIVHVAGFDALNRHSNDSIAATTPYAWGKFPYDTNLTICNNAFSQGVKAISKDVGMIYINTTKIDSIAVVDTGKG
ncbi:MAG TPA: choice-of-anchor D domain-containing protein, partial [Candidatus Kapabacteria bacterium]|nr:choice-of-anchor D domain-containing protein [Candidatus Kapabacteria bacterium]